MPYETSLLMYLKILGLNIQERLSFIYIKFPVFKIFEKSGLEYEEKLKLIDKEFCLSKEYKKNLIIELDLFEIIEKELKKLQQPINTKELDKDFTKEEHKNHYICKFTINSLTQLVHNTRHFEFQSRVIKYNHFHTYWKPSNSRFDLENRYCLLMYKAHKKLKHIFKKLNKDDLLLNLLSYIDNKNIKDVSGDDGFVITEDNSLANCKEHLDEFMPECYILLEDFDYVGGGYFSATMMGEIIAFNSNIINLEHKEISNVTKILLLLIHEFSHFKRFKYSARMNPQNNSPDVSKNGKPEIGKFIQRRICVLYYLYSKIYFKNI
jgi:hypothetical protein